MMDHGRDKSLSPDIPRLSRLLQRNPASRLFVPLAEAYLKSDKRDEAIRVLTEGIVYHPTFVAARVMLGKIFFQMEAWSKAKTQFEGAIKTNPENIPSLKNLGAIYQEEGDLHRALESYRVILSIDPGDKVARRLFVTLEEEISEPSLPEMNTNNFEPKKNPSITSSEIEEKILNPSDTPSLIEAQTDEESILEENSESGTPFPLMVAEVREGSQEKTLETQTLASIYMSQGCYQEAADIYTKLLARDPDDIESRNGLKVALSGLSEPIEKPRPVLASSEPIRLEAEIARLEGWLHVIQVEKRP